MGDAMASCPECGDALHYRAKKCSCGWVAKAVSNHPLIDIDAVRSASVAVAQKRCAAWLAKRGLMPVQSESREGYMHRLADFRLHLRRTPRPDSKQWAKDILQDNDDGVMVPVLSLHLAHEALGVPAE